MKQDWTKFTESELTQKQLELETMLKNGELTGEGLHDLEKVMDWIDRFQCQSDRAFREEELNNR